MLGEGPYHLLCHGHAGVHYVVAQEHGEGLVPHQVTGAVDGMPEPQGLFLAGVGEADGLAYVADHPEDVLLPLLAQDVLQLEGDVEVVLDGALAPAGDYDYVLYPARRGLLHAVLDDRPVHHREELLGDGLRGGQEPRAEARRRENCLPYHHVM